jgi:AbrB family looped-hinge helix DNA binding protein
MVKHPHMKIEWSASIGTKWQIVIPKNVREKFNLKPWNNLVVLSSDSAMILIKSEDLKDMMKCFENIIKDYTEIQK